jgi:hypothetical protein
MFCSLAIHCTRCLWHFIVEQICRCVIKTKASCRRIYAHCGIVADRSSMSNREGLSNDDRGPAAGGACVNHGLGVCVRLAVLE